jgi:hypothetical protein
MSRERTYPMANALTVIAKIRAAKGKGDALAALLTEHHHSSAPRHPRLQRRAIRHHGLAHRLRRQCCEFTDCRIAFGAQDVCDGLEFLGGWVGAVYDERECVFVCCSRGLDVLLDPAYEREKACLRRGI